MPHPQRTQLSAQIQPAAGYRLQAVSVEGRTAGFALKPGKEYLLTREKAAAADRKIAPDAEPLAVGFGLPEVSACHALLRIEDDCLVIRDLGSTNGTFAADGSTPITDETRLPLPTTIHLAQEVVSITVTHPATGGTAPLQQTRLDLADLHVGDSLTIGRGKDCDLVLDHPSISRRHCSIERTSAAFHLIDHGSLNGTYLADAPIRGRTLLPEPASIRLGPFALMLAGESLAASASPGLPLAVRHLTCTVPAGRGTRRTILRNVGFTVKPGEFVAVIGRSGSGKTTLINRLAGVTGGGQRGCVSIGDCPIPEDLPRLAQLVGYVPQRETLHARLTVRQALDHTIGLRSPDPISPGDRLERIRSVLADLELPDKLDARIANLSGGERRRLSLAAELLAQPKILFLDEITSGLDASTERSLMRIFRNLADAGTTVVCITHHVENVHLCDRVAVLTQAVEDGAGTLAFFGTPDACLAHFGVDRFAAVFDTAVPAGAADSGATAQPLASPAEKVAVRRVSRWRHWRLVLRRQLQLLRADPRALALLIGQPLLVGLILLIAFANLDPLAYGPGSDVWKVAFLLAVATVWFATTAAAREVVSERPVLEQERRAGLHVSSYLAAKLCVLTGAGFGQAVLLLALTRLLPADEPAGFLSPWRGMTPWPEALLLLTLASGAGAASGLLLSVLARSARQAATLVPYLLLPQIILGGALVPTVLDGSAGGVIRSSLGALLPVNWTYAALRIHETDLPAATNLDPALPIAGGDPWVALAVNQHGMDWYLDGRAFADPAFWLAPAVLLAWGLVVFAAAAILLRHRCPRQNRTP
jgi:ABC transport system ATP-binding/permease protein